MLENIKKLEEHYKMKFKEVIEVVHLKANISLTNIAKRSGVCRSAIANEARRMGLTIKKRGKK